jgi:DNA-binding SARP family transcriptional activator
MRIGLLGAIRVDDGDDAVDVPGAKQRALLALLAVNAGTVVSDGRILDELWGDALPDNPANALQKRVSELRKLLGADRVSRRGDGYVLELPRHDVDSLDFEDQVAVAHTAPQLAAALALWRGPALAELADLPFARAEAAVSRSCVGPRSRTAPRPTSNWDDTTSWPASSRR